jgi:hypothetical protein
MKDSHQCPLCDVTFSNASLYNRHMENRRSCISTKQVMNIYNENLLVKDYIKNLHNTLQLNKQI